MDDKNYWRKYYLTHSKPTIQSSFAEFVLQYLDKNKNLLELGCGNGRDTIYFSKNGLNCVGVDQICDEITFLNKNFASNNLKFICDDFTNLKNSSNDYIQFDYIYSRFTFHAIDEKQEKRTLNWISNHLNNGLFFVEARSIKDSMLGKGEKLSPNENFTNHYRRFLNLDDFVDKLKYLGFEILFKIENCGLAVYKDDDPYVIRVIAHK